MISDETDDFDLVGQDPAAWYRRPHDILDDPQLDRTEKARLLDEWARDLVQRSVAADEGMVPDTPGLIDRDTRMQDRVAEAQAQLAATAAIAARQTVTRRLWRRITGADRPPL
jgi:hypothetical protein